MFLWHNKNHILIFVYLFDHNSPNFDSSSLSSQSRIHTFAHSPTVRHSLRSSFALIYRLLQSSPSQPSFPSTLEISSSCRQTSVTHTTTTMLSSSLFAAALSLAVGVQAHMSITFPPPFDAPTNPAANPKNVDINAPINAAGFPCRGLHKKGVPSAATLIAGAESKITFSKGAPHAGGSCQVALSYDQTSFYVIHSWQGGCPVDGEGSLSFTVPSDAPTGPATFAWTWINKLGNREFYMYVLFPILFRYSVLTVAQELWCSHNCCWYRAGSQDPFQEPTRSLRRQP